ncbi:MAG: ABC-F type ribosomal protection protein [Clostridia bacterium]|nr:ABC-F type ribosomal protection protein [Clostridia bacterium]
MATITISNLTFAYEDSYENVFENVSFSIDTNWKLGFIGRNGRGKTTFLKLLLGKLEYSGTISSPVNFDYFPFEIQDKSKNSCEIAEMVYPNYEFWKLCKEISLLQIDEEILFRPFETLSNGEQTKILLAILFLKEDNFLLIDEPTNHLDMESREAVSKYLNRKNGFILVSHDRAFLDSCIDHVLSINRNNIEIQKGNYSSWQKNKENNDNMERSQNEKLIKEIERLDASAKRMANWSNKTEASKHRVSGQKDNKVDKGFVGHKSAKMMKRSLSSQNRKEKSIEEKSKLLKNIETADNLKISPIMHCQNKLVDVLSLSVVYDGKPIFKPISFSVENGDRVWLCGKNGCGKSSLIKLILGENINFSGDLNIVSNLKISYVSQDTSNLSGNLTDFSKKFNIDESLFKAILRKLDFSREQFDKNIEDFSGGQKKKVLIARSLCEQAHIYIWDEPLNFIDVLSRIQIEDLILKYEPTMIFVEHDQTFSKKIATKIINLKK